MWIGSRFREFVPASCELFPGPSLYQLAGAGFWEIDWAKALEYYSNAYLNAPNMYDQSSGYTAQQRYAEASFAYANQLVAASDFCGSITYYDQGYSIGANDMVAPTATAAYLACYPPTSTPEPIVPGETLVPTLPLDLPTDVPIVDNLDVTNGQNGS